MSDTYSDTSPMKDLPAPTKKDRSPSFPFITLTKSIERARELFMVAKRHEMRLADAAKAMGYGAKSSGAIQTLAALIAYGLVEDSGAGEARKYRISDLAFKMLEDQRPGARESALAQAAATPKLIVEYAEKWGRERPANSICLSELRFERGFTEDGAQGFLRVYDDAMSFAKASGSDKLTDNGGKDSEGTKRPSAHVSVGDLVQAAPGGVIAFEKVRVRAVQEHNGQTYAFLEGTETGCAMSDITVLERALPPPAAPPMLALSMVEAKLGPGEGMDQFTVDEGVVKITFPDFMTTASVADLEAFFTLFIKKAKRRAGPT